MWSTPSSSRGPGETGCQRCRRAHDSEQPVLGDLLVDLRRQRAASSVMDLAGDGGGRVTDPSTRHGQPVRAAGRRCESGSTPAGGTGRPKVVITVRLTPVVYFGGYSGDKEA
jgi:hypothetical protein